MSAGGYTRVYTPQGQVAHLMRPIAAGPADDYRHALCPSVPPGDSQWLGTGDQAEYERAEALPLCAACGHLAGIGAAS
jgi:hypothetical protein